MTPYGSSVLSAGLAHPMDGDQSAFGQELDAHIDALYRFALLWHEDSKDAEELVVRVVVKAYRLWHAFSPAVSPHLRFFSVLRTEIHPSAGTSVTSHLPWMEDGDPQAAPESEAGKSRTALVRALQALSPRYRELFSLRLGSRLSCEEVAWLTGEDPDELQREFARAGEVLRESSGVASAGSSV